jgi:SAM-dependent methyltransferase
MQCPTWVMWVPCSRHPPLEGRCADRWWWRSQSSPRKTPVAEHRRNTMSRSSRPSARLRRAVILTMRASAARRIRGIERRALGTTRRVNKWLADVFRHHGHRLMRSTLIVTLPGEREHSMRSLGGSARRGLRKMGWLIEDRRLEAEQRRGVLGPAHTRWRDVADHSRYWSAYDWGQQGEEWTASPEWKQALIDDVLSRWIPSGVVTVEIGPGAGRWTEVLVARASRLVLVDVSERPLELCRQRFGESDRIGYVLTPDSSLPGVADGSIDAVWSFDVFVHLAPRYQARYVKEISRVLAPGASAVIHHADGRNRGRQPSRLGWRSPMSRNLFAVMAMDCGLGIQCQFDSWGPDGRYDLGAFGDAITVVQAPL